MRGRKDRIRYRLLLLAIALSGILGATAAQAATLKVVRYHGFSVTMPRSWPVYDLSAAPRTCVRFNRHALYLGAPRTSQSCPATELGRTEAILLTPGTHAPRSVSALGSHSTTFTSGAVTVTATWNRDPGVIARALHRRSLPGPPRAPASRADGAR